MIFSEVEVSDAVEGYAVSASQRHPDTLQLEDAEGRKYLLVNPEQYDWHSGRFGYRRNDGLIGLWFDQHAPLRLLVWANGYEDALEECAGWLSDHGLKGMFAEFSDDDREAARRELEESDGPDDEEAVQQHLEVDHTYTESGLIPSDDWGDLFSPESGNVPEDLLRACMAIGKELEEGAAD